MNRLVYFILLFFVMKTYAQERVYNGIVYDANSKQPIEIASVCLLMKDSTILSYAYTDKNGYFELREQAHTGNLLSISCMGYKKVIVSSNDFINGSRIMLEEDNYKLPEVKIKSNRITQREDTLVYSVKGFKMPQDRSIEDVLKKIPGIEVAKNGQIKFQDRAISNFYIDGMDLLDSRYTLASRNIPADIVKEVQVLQSHQPISALRGKTFSDNTALNLTIESDVKNRLIGIVDCGLGIEQKERTIWDNRLMGMLFGKNMQNLTMYKNNNTGKDVADEIDTQTTKTMVEMSKMDLENDFFSAQPSLPDGIDRSRYLFNNVHLAAVNHLYKPKKEKELRLQLVALHDNQSANHEQESTYIYPSQVVVVNERENYKSIENRIETEMSYTHNDSSFFVKNTLRGLVSLHKNTLSLMTGTEPFQVYNHPQRKLLQNNFHFIKSYRKHSISFYSNNSYMELPQYMTVTPGPYDELLTGGQEYEYLRQDALLRSIKSDTYTYFQHKLGTLYLKYRAGVVYENRYLQSFLYADSQVMSNEDFSNKVRLETIETYIEPSLNIKTDYWDFQFRLPLAYYYSRLKNTLPQLKKESKYNILLTPSLNLKYNLNAYWNVGITSTFGLLKPDIRRLYAGYLFNTYRTIQSFTQNLTFDKNIYNLLRFCYNNPLNGLFVNWDLFFNQTWQDNINVYDNKENILSTSQSYYNPNIRRNYGGRVRFSKSSGWHKLFTALSFSYNKTDDNMVLEKDWVKSELTVLSIAADLSLQPSRYINVKASSTARSVQSQLNLDAPVSTCMWNYEHSLDINLIFSSTWRAKIENFFTHNNQSKNFSYFADASITFALKKWLLELELHNMFDNGVLNNSYIDSRMKQDSKYFLHRREILLKTSFSF